VEIRDHKRTKIECKRKLKLLPEEKSKITYVNIYRTTSDGVFHNIKSKFVKAKKGLFLNLLVLAKTTSKIGFMKHRSKRRNEK